MSKAQTVPFKSVEQCARFMQSYFKQNNIEIPKDAITEELITSFIPIYREGKEKSPKKADPTLSFELYSKWCEDTTLNVYDKIYERTGKQIAQALADVGINAEELVGTTNYNKKKKELTNALIEAYNKKSGQVSLNDESNKSQDKGSDDNASVKEDTEEDNLEEDDPEVLRRREIDASYDNSTVKELKALCKERSIEIVKMPSKLYLTKLLVEYEMNT
jgi:hypothetical protein